MFLNKMGPNDKHLVVNTTQCHGIFFRGCGAFNKKNLWICAPNKYCPRSIIIDDGTIRNQRLTVCGKINIQKCVQVFAFLHKFSEFIEIFVVKFSRSFKENIEGTFETKFICSLGFNVRGGLYHV